MKKTSTHRIPLKVHFLGWLLFFALIPGFSFAEKGDYVVVLHGIAHSSASMEKIKDRLIKAGYKVLNVDYPSTDYGLETLVEKIYQEVSSFNQSSNRQLHFVTFSMGGLVGPSPPQKTSAKQPRAGRYVRSAQSGKRDG